MPQTDSCEEPLSRIQNSGGADDGPAVTPKAETAEEIVFEAETGQTEERSMNGKAPVRESEGPKEPGAAAPPVPALDSEEVKGETAFDLASILANTKGESQDSHGDAWEEVRPMEGAVLRGETVFDIGSIRIEDPLLPEIPPHSRREAEPEEKPSSVDKVSSATTPEGEGPGTVDDPADFEPARIESSDSGGEELFEVDGAGAAPTDNSIDLEKALVDVDIGEPGNNGDETFTHDEPFDIVDESFSADGSEEIETKFVSAASLAALSRKPATEVSDNFDGAPEEEAEDLETLLAGSGTGVAETVSGFSRDDYEQLGGALVETVGIVPNEGAGKATGKTGGTGKKPAGKAGKVKKEGSAGKAGAGRVDGTRKKTGEKPAEPENRV